MAVFQKKLLSTKEFSRLLEFVYTGQNLQSSFFDLLSVKQIIKLFKNGDPKYLMTKEEYKKLKSMQDEILIFGGGVTNDDEHSHVSDRISWTTNKKNAKRFSLFYQRIFSGYRSIIVSGKIKKTDILALFNGRNEDEVGCDPRNVFDLQYIICQ